MSKSRGLVAATLTPPRSTPFPEKAGPFQGAGEAGEPLVAELAGGEADLLVADARKKSL
jgi:hypothetical protein